MDGERGVGAPFGAPTPRATGPSSLLEERELLKGWILARRPECSAFGGQAPLGRGGEWRNGDGERVRMRFASAPFVVRAAAWEIICGLGQAFASTPMRAGRGIIRDKAQASASTPRRAEREIIRGKTRASTVVGQARWGCEPWVIIRGEGTRASAARMRCGKGGREGALAIRDILNWSNGLPRDTGMDRGQKRRRVSVAGRSHTARLRRADVVAMRLMGLLWSISWIGPTYRVGAWGIK